MDENNVTQYKYDHGESSGHPLKPFLLTGMGVMVVSMFFIAIPAGIVGLIAGFILLAIFWPKKNISLFPRYLVCGRTVLYYRNVDQIVLHEAQGTLTLFWGNRKSLCIDREKFPTNARKTNKIEANKKTKFSKVSQKIIDKIVLVQPDVKVLGTNRPPEQSQ